MDCSFFKFRLTITHMYSRFPVQALHIHTLMLESNYIAHSSDQNSPSTGPEAHTAWTTLNKHQLFSLRPFMLTLRKCQLVYDWFMGCPSFKFRLTIKHVYSRFRIQALHLHTLTLDSSYTAHSSDQNSPSTGPESHTALTTLTTMLYL